MRRARSDSTPTTTRSGRMKSLIAAPSRRNSGLEATSKSAPGRASRDHAPLAPPHGLRAVRSERESPGGHVLFHEVLEPGLVDRHHALFERGDLVGVLIDAHHLD